MTGAPGSGAVNRDQEGRHVATIWAEFGAFELHWRDGDVRVAATEFPTEVVPWGEFEPRKIVLTFLNDPYSFPGYSSGMWPGGAQLNVDTDYFSSEDPELLVVLRSGDDAAGTYYEELLVNGETVVA